jgi:hypothetical protein
MHANICDPDDKGTVVRFRNALDSLGALLLDHEWVADVDLWRFRIGSGVLRVFVDTWSVDIDGPDELVEKVLSTFQGDSTGPPARC